MINFNEYKIFESALGQHNLICMLSKNKNNNICKIKYVNRKGFYSNTLKNVLEGLDKETDYYNQTQDGLYDGRQNNIIFRNSSSKNYDDELNIIVKMKQFTKLGEIFNLSQTSSKNCNYLSSKVSSFP